MHMIESKDSIIQLSNPHTRRFFTLLKQAHADGVTFAHMEQLRDYGIKAWCACQAMVEGDRYDVTFSICTCKSGSCILCDLFVLRDGRLLKGASRDYKDSHSKHCAVKIEACMQLLFEKIAS